MPALKNVLYYTESSPKRGGVRDSEKTSITEQRPYNMLGLNINNIN